MQTQNRMPLQPRWDQRHVSFVDDPSDPEGGPDPLGPSADLDTFDPDNGLRVKHHAHAAPDDASPTESAVQNMANEGPAPAKN